MIIEVLILVVFAALLCGLALNRYDKRASRHHAILYAMERQLIYRLDTASVADIKALVAESNALQSKLMQAGLTIEAQGLELRTMINHKRVIKEAYDAEC